MSNLNRNIRYLNYWIVPKLDHQPQHGWVVTDGICNIMPGGCWFETITEAKEGIDTFILTKGNAAHFWEIMQPFGYKLGQRDSSENAVVTCGRFSATIENYVVVRIKIKPAPWDNKETVILEHGTATVAGGAR